jgi:hypothetical protein
LNAIFENLTNKSSEIDIESLRKLMDVKAYHSYKLMMKNEERVREELYSSFNFVKLFLK